MTYAEIYAEEIKQKEEEKINKKVREWVIVADLVLIAVFLFVIHVGICYSYHQ